ncbi:uncharacterized protein [Argopecten irradians]|uniref:uncharacterized protein isoform X2 n=1 Tax=Argopecten irradians TaxID=31199 RepID=UPI0037132F5E
MKQPMSVGDVKRFLGQILQLQPKQIDVIKNTAILNDHESDFKNVDVTEVMFHKCSPSGNEPGKTDKTIIPGPLIGFKYRRISDSYIHTLIVKKQPSTVSDVKTVICKSMGLSADNIDVINNAQILEPGERNFKSEGITEILFHRTHRRVPLRMKVKEEDMFEGDMADGDRIKMSCGHATTPENLYRYCLTKLNSCDLSFKCMECDEVWELPEISKKADMTDDESEFFSRKMTKVFIENSNDIRECPICRIPSTRNNPNDKQVECVNCKKDGKAAYTFCWECNVLCDKSHDCKRYKIKHAQDILDNCERVTMSYSSIPNVPKVRACPNCKVLIEHTGGCKTMDCGNPTCKLTFCFSCLKPKKENGGLQCGNYESKCIVAPVQKLVV